VHVTLDADMPDLQRAFDSVPPPDDARPAAGTDGHLLVWQPATDRLWEFWKLRRASDGWHARWGGAMSDVSRNAGYFPAPFGATGTGLPLLGGLIRASELRSGRIDHALALAIPKAKAGQFVWPAQRSDGSGTGPDAIPEGTRLRIDPRLDLSTLGLPLRRQVPERHPRELPLEPPASGARAGASPPSGLRSPFDGGPWRRC
jgi:hypothetical protein